MLFTAVLPLRLSCGGVERYLLPLDQAAHACALESGRMDEHVLAAVRQAG